MLRDARTRRHSCRWSCWNPNGHLPAQQLRNSAPTAARSPTCCSVRGDLAELFDGPSTVQFDPGVSMLSLDLSAVSGSDTLIGLVMTCASTWMEAALADPRGGQRLVVYDEAWRLLASRSAAEPGLVEALTCLGIGEPHRSPPAIGSGIRGRRRLGGPWSRGGAARGHCELGIFRNEPFEESQAAGKGLGLHPSVEVAQLPLLARGEGLWRVNE